MIRRDVLKAGAAAGAATLVAGRRAWAAPRREPFLFRPYPHPLQPDLRVYATDARFDPFASSVEVTAAGVAAPEAMAATPFGVNARWFVEGFGFVWLTADNAGRLYSADDLRRGPLNLNVEFARSRAAQNADAIARYQAVGTVFSTEALGLDALARNLLEDAERLERAGDGAAAGDRANASLNHALWAGEHIEIEHARAVLSRPRPGPFLFGCETRQMVWAKAEPMMTRFEELFSAATVTHYVWDSWYEPFEPREGVYRWGIKDDIVDWLTEAGIDVEGRPIVWFHPDVTPAWLADKSFPEVMAYTERHARDLVQHYGDRVLRWEVVNEYHDWANVHGFSPDQITAVTRLACEATHDANAAVERIVNNCCLWGEYAASGRRAGAASDLRLRTPRRFVQDLVEADVPFETVGLQLYFPQRTIADVVRHVDRFAAFGKPVSVTEMGASSGPTRADVALGKMEIPGPLYDWHRHWDTDLQADWLEQMLTVLYAHPAVHAVNWYDFADFRTFIPNGGLILEDATPKPSFERFRETLAGWGHLPAPRTP